MIFTNPKPKPPFPPEDLLLGRAQRIRLEERELLAHNLHDSISPLLAVARMNLEAIHDSESYTNDQAAKEMLIENTLTLIQHTLEEVKHLTKRLKNEEKNNFDLKNKLEDFCKKINDTRVLYVDLNIGMGIPIFNSTMGSELFYILKELLHNTLKHARASKVNISLQQQNGILVLTYRDNGIGYIPKTDSKQDQIGLCSIFQRLQKFNSRYQLRAERGYGFRLTANIPLSYDHLK